MLQVRPRGNASLTPSSGRICQMLLIHTVLNLIQLPVDPIRVLQVKVEFCTLDRRSRFSLTRPNIIFKFPFSWRSLSFSMCTDAQPPTVFMA